MFSESERDYRGLFESMTDGVVVMDTAGRIREANPAYRAMLGYSEEELHRLTSAEITPERWHEVDADIVRDQILARGYSDAYEKEYRRKDGSIFPVELRCFLLRDDSGEPCGIGAVVRDITEFSKGEQVVRENDDRLRVSTLRGLLSILAHELGQPLAAMVTNAQAGKRFLARDPVDLGELSAIFDDIALDGDRAVKFIQSVLSRLPKAVAERLPILLNDLVKDTLPIACHSFGATNIAIQLDLDPSLPAVDGDPIQLQQVLLALLANAFEAIQSSERGGRITVRTRGTNTEIVLDVVDSGEGISDNRLKAIFDPFVTTKTERLGMGLALSRSIAIGHEGRIWAENNSNGGATFHLALPLKEGIAPGSTVEVDQARPAPRPGDSAVSGKPTGITVLIADDYAAFRRAVASILADLPNLECVYEAADGREAVAKAAELNPDLVLLDLSLPVIDGVEAARRIHELVPGSRILFLTQYESSDFVEAALRAGARGYVLKVDTGSELLQAAIATLRGETYTSSSIRRAQR